MREQPSVGGDALLHPERGNFKNKDVTLTINRDLSGEVVKTSPAARVDQVAKGLRKANPRSLLRWEIPIKARDKAEVEYVYRVYVRD